MKRLMLIGFACILALVSCSREQEFQAVVRDDSSVEGEPVTIQFTVPVSSPATRSLEDCGELKTLHLAVFGGSGYLKEYVQAIPVRTDDYTYEMPDKDDRPVTVTVPCYTYTVTLSLSESPRTVHFLGNGPSLLPFGYDTAIMPIQLCAAGEMGYWQKLYLPDGIRAKRNEDGYFVNQNGDIIPEGGRGYIADDVTEAAFQGIPLIRNWSKVVLKADNSYLTDPANGNDAFFTPISFAVVNVPSRGTMAPYSAATGFIDGYQNLSFPQLEGLSYPGNLPAGASFDSSIPAAESFRAPFGEGVVDASTGAAYLYERPIPSDRHAPSYIIVYGHYRNPDDLGREGDYFYKVDLMETKEEVIGGETSWNARYYPIYRNFKYQIILRKILSPGHATPEEAATSAGSADVSADVTTSHLADISDGAARLHVTPWLAHTFTEAHGEDNPVNVLNVFFSQQPDSSPDMDPSSVRIELLPMDDGGEDIIYNLSIGQPSGEVESLGWRPVSFCTVGPGRTVRSQTIRIIGTYSTGRLYRDIVITILPVQPMKVSCSHARIGAFKGTEQGVVVSIPDGLVESMFPLEFLVEAEDMTLTPDNSYADNNLPVTYGTSISETEGYAGKQAFRFIRTVTWEEYLRLSRYEDEDNQTWRTFTCHFKTNCDESATRVWVYNPFFQKSDDRFENYHNKFFQNLHFTVPIPEESDVTIPLHFEMVEDSYGNYPDDYPVITIAPRGLMLVGDGVSPGDDPGTYYFKPTSHDVTLTFISTTSYADEFSVDLTAEEYEPGRAQTCRFQLVQLIDGHALSNSNGSGWLNNAWSNVAWGYVNDVGNKNVLFGYKDDPNHLNPPVTVEAVGLTLSKAVNSSGLRSTYAEPGYHEIEFKTVGGTSDVELTLSSPGYITEHLRAGRFHGDIRTMKDIKTGPFSANNTYGFSVAHPSFVYEQENGKIQVTFSEISQKPNGNVVFRAGGTYTMTVESLKSTQTLFYMDMWFRSASGVIYAPESFDAVSAGTISRYPGSNNQYVWNIPRGQSSVSVTFRAPDAHDVILETFYVKAFEGYLMENGTRIP